MPEFVCVYETRIGDTELNFHHIATGISIEKVAKEHEVEHDGGLDTEDSPIGGANGQYCTELIKVLPITLVEKRFLNEIGIH